jgi:cell division protein FtsL
MNAIDDGENFEFRQIHSRLYTCLYVCTSTIIYATHVAQRAWAIEVELKVNVVYTNLYSREID